MGRATDSSAPNRRALQDAVACCLGISRDAIIGCSFSLRLSAERTSGVQGPVPTELRRHPAEQCRIEVQGARSPTRWLVVEVSCEAEPTTGMTGTLTIEARASCSLVTVCDRDGCTHVAIRPDARGMRRRRLSIPVPLQRLAKGSLRGTYSFCDSIRDDVLARIGEAALLTDADNCCSAAEFIAFPWERVSDDVQIGHFCPIFFSDDAPIDEVIRACQTAGIHCILAPETLLVPNATNLRIVRYDSSSAGLRKALEEEFGVAEQKASIFCPSAPDLLLLSAWFARRTGRRLMPYEAGDTGLPQTDNPRDVVVSLGAKVASNTKARAIFPESATDLSRALLDMLDDEVRGPVLLDMIHERHEALSSYGRAEQATLLHHFRKPDVPGISRAARTAVLCNCQPGKRTRLALAASYAVARRADLYYFGELPALSADRLGHSIEAIDSAFFLEEQTSPSREAPESANMADVRTDRVKPTSSVTDCLRAFTLTLDDVQDQALWQRLSSVPPHYVITIGDTRIPVEFRLLGVSARSLLSLGNVSATGHLDLSTDFATTCAQIASIRCLLPFRVDGSNLLILDPTGDLEDVSVEESAIGELLRGHGEPEPLILKGEEATTERLLELLPDAKLIYYSGHGVVLEGETPALLLANGDVFLMDMASGRGSRPSLFVLNGCLTAGESPFSTPGFAERVFGFGGCACIGTVTRISSLTGAYVGFSFIRNELHLPIGDSLLFAKHAVAEMSVEIPRRRPANIGERSQDATWACDFSWLSFQLYGDPASGRSRNDVLSLGLFLENLSDLSVARGDHEAAAAWRALAGTLYAEASERYEEHPEGDSTSMLAQGHLVLGESFLCLAIKTNRTQEERRSLLRSAQGAFAKAMELSSSRESTAHAQLLQAEAYEMSLQAEAVESREGGVKFLIGAAKRMRRAAHLVSSVGGTGSVYAGMAYDYIGDARLRVGNVLSESGDHDGAFRSYLAAAESYERACSRYPDMEEASRHHRSALRTMAVCIWRRGAALVREDDLDGAAEALSEALRLFTDLEDEANAAQVSGEGTILSLLRHLVRITAGTDDSSLSLQLRTVTLPLYMTFLAAQVLLHVDKEEAEMVLASYLPRVAQAFLEASTAVEARLAEHSLARIGEAALVFACCEGAFFRGCLGESVPRSATRIADRCLAVWEEAGREKQGRGMWPRLLSVFRSVQSQASDQMIRELSGVLDEIPVEDLEGLSDVLSACALPFLNRDLGGLDQQATENAGRILAYVASQTAAVEEKSTLYLRAADCFAGVGDSARSAVYRAMSLLTSPPREKATLEEAYSILDQSPSSFKEGTVEWFLWRENRVSCKIQILIHESQEALSRFDLDSAADSSAAASALLGDAALRARGSVSLRALVEQWDSCLRGIALIVRTESEESTLEQDEIRERYLEAHRALRKALGGSFSELAADFLPKAEGEYYFHAAFRFFERRETTLSSARALRYAKWFFRSAECFAGDEKLRKHSLTHGFQVLGAHHLELASAMRDEGSTALCESHLAKALRYFHEALATRSGSLATPQSVYYRYRLQEIESMRQEVAFESSRAVHYLGLAAVQARRALDTAKEAATAHPSLSSLLREARERYRRLRGACSLMGISDRWRLVDE